ncbi:MAG: hypothetical protein LBG22_05845, partial [Treponema sp.]|nr:hypothetical protein [Treponema sp.]
RHFVPQKPRLTGCFGSLQSKKSPDRRFLEVLRAKRNKLLGSEFIVPFNQAITGPVKGVWRLCAVFAIVNPRDVA